MRVEVFAGPEALAAAAGSHAAAVLRERLARGGRAHVVAATGASQIGFLDVLTRAPGVEWDRVVFFHLDEYVGLPATHPASFRRYLRERIVDRVSPAAFHFIEGDAPAPEIEARRVGALLAAHPTDVAFVGIGENGHLAFNDPPADFESEEPYRVVRLDEACRRQQLGEGWFPALEDVPATAISMSVRQILKAGEILCVVPEARKAAAVAASLEGPVSETCPASILRRHPNTTVYLDRDSAALLRRATAPMG